VPDIDDRQFTAFVQHLVDDPVIANAYPVKIFCTRKLVCIMGNRIPCKVLNMFKNAEDHLPGDLPEILFSA